MAAGGSAVIGSLLPIAPRKGLAYNDGMLQEA